MVGIVKIWIDLASYFSITMNKFGSPGALWFAKGRLGQWLRIGQTHRKIIPIGQTDWNLF
jgi:hypothetical protein